MAKRRLCLLLGFLLLLSLSGCWSYRGLNEIVIVAGMALDKNGENGRYKLSFEFVTTSTSSSDNGGASSEILESEGDTLFEAVRMAKRKVKNRLYFGHTQLFILSQELARTEDIGPFLDFVMRDNEVRETMLLCVSQDDTAQDILKASGIDEKILSIKLQKILENDSKLTASTVDVAVYNAFDIINTPGRDLALAAVRTVKNGEESIPVANGIAVFKDRKLVGFLPPDEARMFLFCVGKVEGGICTFPSTDGGENDCSLEIAESQTKRSVEERNGEPVIKLEVNIIGFLGEIMHPGVVLDLDKVKELQRRAADELEREIGKLVKKVQTLYKADIFGFGSLVNQKSKRLWKTIQNRWDSMFESVQVDVKVDVTIANTAALGKS